jgi:hypothetical protein
MFPGFLKKIPTSTLRAVAADREENIHSMPYQGLHRREAGSTGPREVPSIVPPC